MALREQRENSGILFKNNFKKDDKHPDYKGAINVGGEEFALSAWIKDRSSGKFLSLSVRAKEQEQKPRVVGGRDFDDDVGF